VRYPTVAHEWFEEVWNQQNEAAIDMLLRPDAVAHGLTESDEPLPQGPEGFKPFHRMLLQAFPDLHVKVEDCVPDGNRVAVRCTVTGTHLGEYQGVAPTGRKIHFTGVTYLRLDGGQLAEGWNYFDFDSLRSQIS
jgi:steroid delta-isomerase-like uncharacterized protein